MSGFRTAVQMLATAQKSSRGVSLYSRWINRPLGRVLAAMAHQLGLTPNIVTALSAAATTLALVLLIMIHPRPWLGPLVALVLMVGFALDSADGQLARLSGRSTSLGEWLDHVVDAGKMVCVHAAVLVAGYRYWSTPDGWLAVPLVFQVVAVVMFSGLVLVDLVPRARGEAAGRRGATSLLRAVLLLPADYGVLAASFVLWGAPVIFLGWYSLLALANAVILIGMLVRWYRRLADGAVAVSQP